MNRRSPDPANVSRGRWLMRYVAPQWGALGAGSLVMAVRAGVLALVPWPLKFIIDTVIGNKPLPSYLAAVLPGVQSHRIQLLGVLCVSTLVLGLADAVFNYVGSRLFLDAGQRLVYALRTDLFSHLQRLSLDFHRRHRGGDLMSRLSGDVQKIQDLITAVGGDLIQHVLVIVGVAAIMFRVDWRYALVVLGTIPLLLIIIRIYTRLLRRAIRQVRHHEGDLWSIAQEAFGCVQLIQSYGRERHEERRFAAGAQKIFKASAGANDLQAQFSPVLTFAIAAATALIAWYGAVRVLDGRITAGEMIVFLTYFRALTAPTRRMAKTARIIGRASVAVERIAEYLFESPTISESVHALVPQGCSGRVDFESVTFGYLPGPNILENVTFRLDPGRTVALVGPTGAGKSTIASLISRFYDPVKGRVLLDGRDLRGLQLSFVRKQVALVLQEPILFQATVWENICYGCEGASRADAIRASRAVGIDEIIQRLPGGYDYLISERGQTLSGGQRQCISIARAMLRDAPVVILDEPSSSLDAQTEHRLLDAIDRLTENRTALVIAHRLRTVMAADEILVLDQGRIVERGCHDQLLHEAGIYARLWTTLSGETEDSFAEVHAFSSRLNGEAAE